MALLIFLLMVLTGTVFSQTEKTLDSVNSFRNTIQLQNDQEMKSNDTMDSSKKNRQVAKSDSGDNTENKIIKVKEDSLITKPDSTERDTVVLDTNSQEFLSDSTEIKTEKTRSLILITVNKKTGEVLANINLEISQYGRVKSDQDGLLEIQIQDADSVSIVSKDSIFKLETRTFSLPADQELTQITLNLVKKIKRKKDKDLSDVDMVVVAKREPLHERKEVSMKTISREEMKEISSTMGDPLRALSSLPGVSNTSDLNVRPYVRGGDERETRHFWNNVPLLQPYHSLSAFSIYNMETVDEIKFYSGGFPVEGNGSLSGALFMNSRPAPLDTIEGLAHFSLLRANFYGGAPIIKNKLGVYFSYQQFLYDWVIKRTMEIIKWSTSNQDFDRTVDRFKKFIDLPNFKDFEFGINYKLTPHISLDYSLLRAKDIFRILDPTESIQDFGNDSVSIFETADKIDTLALVKIPNWIHGMNMRWNLSAQWVMKNTLAYQSQEWDVVFNDNSGDPIYDLVRRSVNMRSHNIFELNKKHLLTFGAGYDYKYQNYDVNLPKIAYEMLIHGNPDLVESVGHFNPEGFVIRSNSLLSNLDDYAEHLIMNYDGWRGQHFASAYVADEFKLDSNMKMDGGVRFEYENTSRSYFFAPRLSWYQRIDRDNELSFSVGLYSQNEFEFHYRHFNPNLKSEKAWHLNAEWSHDISPYYGFEWSNYVKYYYDLASIRLVDTDDLNTGLIWDALDLFTQFTFENNGTDSIAALLGIQESELYLKRDSLFEDILDLLPNAQAQIIRDALSRKRLDYSSTGKGYAVGSELSFKYDPTKIWRGWISGEGSLSRRKDGGSTVWYNFRKHRPWSIKWHNYFNFPNKYELSIKANLSAGQAYTGFTDFNLLENGAASDTVFAIEKKNNRRYNPYTRVDFRLTKKGTLWGHEFVSLFEIWNSFNEPNFILTDNKTNEAKFFEFNFPFPTIFLGYEWRW